MKKNAWGILSLLFIASCSGSGYQSDAYGNFEATEVIVSAQNGGQILWLHAEEGDVLRAGEQVGLVDTVDLFLNKQWLLAQRASIQAQFAVLQAQVDVQRQQVINLEKDFARVKNMLKDGAATQKQYDDIDGGIETAKRQIAATESQRVSLKSQQTAIDKQIDQLENNIAKSRIINPQEGTVLVKYAEAGEMAIPAKALYKLGNLSKMRLKVYVSETQLSSIHIGQKADVLIDALGGQLQHLEGTVSWISDKAEFTPKTIQTRDERVNLVYAVKIRVPNEQGIVKIGMPGEVNFR